MSLEGWAQMGGTTDLIVLVLLRQREHEYGEYEEDGSGNLNMMAGAGTDLNTEGPIRREERRGLQIAGVEGMSDNDAGSIHEKELDASDPAMADGRWSGGREYQIRMRMQKGRFALPDVGRRLVREELASVEVCAGRVRR